MLTRVILFPCVFSSVIEAEAQIIIMILKDLIESGIVLVDNQDVVLKEIEKNINDWTPKFKPKVKELIKKLDKKSRFVKVPMNQPLIQPCNSQVGKKCIKIFTSEEFYSVLVEQPKCMDNNQVNAKITLIENYSISRLVNKLRKNDFAIGKGKWNEDTLQQELVIPLFRDAKRISLYDRWIGRSISEGKTNHQYTLEWLLDIFQRVATIRTDTTFEVYCGIHDRIGNATLSNAVNSLRQFEIDTQKRFPYFKMFIKKEAYGNELPHDRYLITNQTAMYIGRGFDLFVDENEPHPRRIRDLQIGYCSNPEEVEPYYRKLPDL